VRGSAERLPQNCLSQRSAVWGLLAKGKHGFRKDLGQLPNPTAVASHFKGGRCAFE